MLLKAEQVRAETEKGILERDEWTVDIAREYVNNVVAKDIEQASKRGLFEARTKLNLVTLRKFSGLDHYHDVVAHEVFRMVVAILREAGYQVKRCWIESDNRGESINSEWIVSWADTGS